MKNYSKEYMKIQAEWEKKWKSCIYCGTKISKVGVSYCDNCKKKLARFGN